MWTAIKMMSPYNWILCCLGNIAGCHFNAPDVNMHSFSDSRLVNTAFTPAGYPRARDRAASHQTSDCVSDSV